MGSEISFLASGPYCSRLRLLRVAFVCGLKGQPKGNHRLSTHQFSIDKGCLLKTSPVGELPNVPRVCSGGLNKECHSPPNHQPPNKLDLHHCLSYSYGCCFFLFLFFFVSPGTPPKWWFPSCFTFKPRNKGIPSTKTDLVCPRQPSRTRSSLHILARQRCLRLTFKLIQSGRYITATPPIRLDISAKVCMVTSWHSKPLRLMHSSPTVSTSSILFYMSLRTGWKVLMLNSQRL